MKPTFLKYEKPLLNVILQCADPETAIERIEKSLPLGAEAFGLQVESLKPEFQNKESLSKVFSACGNKPIYITNYRSRSNSGKTDEQLAKELLHIADFGGTLFDIMGDYFNQTQGELTMNPTAIDKQKKLIEALHKKGKEVLMSSHVLKFTPAERVLEIALEHQKRGADIAKIVTGANNPEQEIENLRITSLLKQELKIPFLFLSGGECRLHRRIGGMLGCCMYLCVYEHDELTTQAQPLLSKLKTIRDNFE